MKAAGFALVEKFDPLGDLLIGTQSAKSEEDVINNAMRCRYRASRIRDRFQQSSAKSFDANLAKRTGELIDLVRPESEHTEEMAAPESTNN